MKPFDFQHSATVEEALQAKNSESAFLGGGTNLLDLMKKHIAQPDTIININDAISHRIEENEIGVVIGAAATNTAIATSQLVLKKAPLLAKAILKGASPQIRNMATTGGNMMQRTRCPYFYDVHLPCNKRAPGSGCSAYDGHQRHSAIVGYSEHCVAVHPSDMCVAMVALDAVVNIKRKDGSESVIRFADFHRLPGDHPQHDNNLPDQAIITSIVIPKNKLNKHVGYVKIRDRTEYAFALVSVAAAVEKKRKRIKTVRLSSGGVAHKPWRWREAESYLKGKKPSEKVFQRAAEIVAESTNPLAHNEFKIPLLKAAVVAALHESFPSKS